MSGLRAVLRVSRRDAWRSKGRSSLVVLMVGLPVMVVTALATLIVTFDLSPRENMSERLGAADALIYAPGRWWWDRVPVTQDYTGVGVNFGESPPGAKPARPWTAEEITALLPAGSRLIPRTETVEYYRTDRWFADTLVSEIDARDPIARGAYRLVSGRFAAAKDEVAVSRNFAQYGVTLGSTLTLTGEARTYRVVGIVADPQRDGRQLVVGLPGSGLAAATEPSTEWLVDTPGPVSWDDVERLNVRGLVVMSRALLLDPPSEALRAGEDTSGQESQALVYGLSITMIVLEVVLLAGPAFAVGIRRRRRELALVAVQGASAPQLRHVVLADGLVLGGLAAVLGVGGGLALAWAADPLLSWFGLAPTMGPFEVPWGQVVGVAALGLVSAVLAAVVPARQAARTDVVATLSGRRGAAPARRGWPLAGLVMTALGVTLTFAGTRAGLTWFPGGDGIVRDPLPRFLGVIAGSLLTMLGLVAVTPFLVGVAARLAVRLPLPFKIAARDAARSRGRTAPAVAAVMAATAGLVTVLITSTAHDQEVLRGYQVPVKAEGSLTVKGLSGTGEEMPLVREAVERALPGVPVVPVLRPFYEGSREYSVALVGASCGGDADCGSLYSLTVIGGPDVLRYLLGRDDPALAAALASGKAVVFQPAAVEDGRASLKISTMGATDLRAIYRQAEVPAVTATLAKGRRTDVLLPVSLATDLKLAPRLAELLIDPAVHRVTLAEEDRVVRQVAAVTRVAQVRVERGPQRAGSIVTVLLLAAAITLVLGGTFAATGLAAADARPDVATLGAIGAPPRVRRFVTAGQAWFIAATGVTLGAAVGFVPGVAATLEAANVILPEGVNQFTTHVPLVVIPWASIAALVLLLPLVAAVVAGVFARTRVPLARRVE
ncbi:FtsX-like permease family protein [Sphaerisporangium sp. NPDC051011]|uniref:ABC transporter permease n=1 Tax=Sphaerisporangium sp. NPDC051011 TaxID=3155792 RepID=UPI0033D337E6